MNQIESRRQEAIGRLKARREFTSHLIVYVVVNAMLVALWAISTGGYFWPIWPLLGWGVGLVLHGWTVYFQRPITEEDIRREIERSA